MERTVVALYDNLDMAQNAVQELLNSGFNRDDISLVRTNQQGGYTSGNVADADTMDSNGSGLAAGAGIGAVLGGLAGLLVGLGALAIPGIGPIVAAGPLATTLAGAGLGAATGGLVGALADTGIPEKDAGYFAEGVRRGGTLVTVGSSEAMLSLATEVLNRHSPVDVSQRAAEWQSAGWTGFDANSGPYSATSSAPQTGQDTGLGQSDYRTQTGMTGVNSGGTYEGTGSAGYTGSGTTYGGSGQMTQEPRAHERAAEGDYQARRDFLGGESVEDTSVSASSQMIDTGRGTYGSQGQKFERAQTPASEGHAMEGQIGGHQGSLAGGQTFTPDTGGVNMGTTGMTFGGKRRFEDFDSDFQNDWQTNYRSSGLGYERYQPAYQYGWQLGSRFDDRSWGDFESEARSDWELAHPNDQWRDFGSAVRSGWERFTRGVENAADNIREGAQDLGRDVDRGLDRPGHEAREFGGNMDRKVDRAGDEMRETGRDLGKNFGQGVGTSFDNLDQDFRSDWEQSYRSQGSDYERYQPAYQYGFTAGSEDRYRGRQWPEVESDMRRDWETQHPNDAWDDFKDAVSHAWQRVRGEVRDATD